MNQKCGTECPTTIITTTMTAKTFEKPSIEECAKLARCTNAKMSFPLQSRFKACTLFPCANVHQYVAD